MRSSLFRSAAVLVTSGALVALGTSSALAAPQPVQQVVKVVGSGHSVWLDQDSVKAGSIQFRVNSSVPQSDGDSEITMFRLAPGKSLDNVLADVREEFGGNPAKGTRDLTRDATFVGLADVVHGYTMVVTERLAPGTYYLLDTGTAAPSGTSAFKRFTVRSDRSGVAQTSDRTSALTVRLTSDDRFVAPSSWPHDATVTVSNVSDTLHFMNMVPVKAGTTDKQVQDYFDSGAQGEPPFAKAGPSEGNDVLSPGVSLQLSYDLPAGTYVLLCFIADDQTGMPHAVMGMHKVVVVH